MIVCCIDTCRAHIVGSDAHAPLETLVESMDEVCDASPAGRSEIERFREAHPSDFREARARLTRLTALHQQALPGRMLCS